MSRARTVADFGAGTISAANVTGLTQGITTVDQWRINDSFNNNGTATLGDSVGTWERADGNNDGDVLGSSMSVSSGIWTFPSTGYWRVDFAPFGYANGGAVTALGGGIQITRDNSTYNTAAVQYSSIHSNGAYGNVFLSLVIDIVDTSNEKIKLYIDSDANVIWNGNTSYQRIYAVFTRLGDT